MKAKELEEAGFILKYYAGNSLFWYELRKGNHVFITNDNRFNKGKDTWHIGYENEKNCEECWFGNRLKEMGQFKIVFRMITGKEFKLAHQRSHYNVCG